jgi:hypothetical protein
MLLAAFALGAPRGIKAQEPADVPWPCQIFVSPDAQERCLLKQQSAVDSDLANLRRYASSHAPAALESAQLGELAPPRSWAGRPPLIRALLEARFRAEILRHLVLAELANGDTALHSVAPFESRFRPDDGGRGITMLITNYSNRPLQPAIILYSPLRDERRAPALVVMQGRTAPVGWMQGWAFDPGDLVEVWLQAYRPRLTVAR